MMDKVQGWHCKSVHVEEERGCESRKKAERKPDAPKVRQTTFVERLGRWLLLLLLLVQSGLGVSAAAERQQKRTVT